MCRRAGDACSRRPVRRRFSARSAVCRPTDCGAADSRRWPASAAFLSRVPTFHSRLPSPSKHSSSEAGAALPAAPDILPSSRAGGRSRGSIRLPEGRGGGRRGCKRSCRRPSQPSSLPRRLQAAGFAREHPSGLVQAADSAMACAGWVVCEARGAPAWRTKRRPCLPPAPPGPCNTAFVARCAGWVSLSRPWRLWLAERPRQHPARRRSYLPAAQPPTAAPSTWAAPAAAA